MDQTVEQIEARIDRTREQLGTTLSAIEQKVDAAIDWREQVRARPWLMVGAACVGGAALAATLRARRSHGAGTPAGLHAATAGRRFLGRDTIADVAGTWDTLTAALIGVASTRVKDYIAGRIPGFDEQFARAEQRRPSR
jgi:hypothetical protein